MSCRMDLTHDAGSLLHQRQGDNGLLGHPLPHLHPLARCHYFAVATCRVAFASVKAHFPDVGRSFASHWRQLVMISWACSVFSATNPRGLRRVRFALRCLWNFDASFLWFDYLKDSPQLQRARIPADVLQLPHRPHFDFRLGALDTTRLLVDHQALVAKRLERTLLEQIELGENCTVAELEGKSGGVHTLVLSQQGRFLKEGLLSLSLLNPARETVMNLSVTFGTRRDVMTALVGGLQSCPTHATDRLRHSTHELHGIQPRILLVHALRVLCSQFEVHHIEAVSAQNHVFRSKRYRFKKTVRLSYETLWEMVGGTRRCDGNYDIPVAAERKPLTSYPSKKRSEHRRRFDLLDLMESQIGAALQGPPRESPSLQPKAHCAGTVPAKPIQEAKACSPTEANWTFQPSESLY